MRILCHAQHLSGVGHFVRMHAIARACAPRTRSISSTEGGPCPHRRETFEPEPVPLPTLVRVRRPPVAPPRRTRVDRRRARGARALARATPSSGSGPTSSSSTTIPSASGSSAPRSSAAIEAARRCNASVRVLCSLRDIVRRTRYEDVPEERFEEQVLAPSARSFDAMLVHADPSFTRLEEHFGRAADFPVPVRYTGFVTDTPVQGTRVPAREPYAVLSCGGGTRSLPFLLASIEAFRRLARTGALGAMTLQVFPGPAPSDEELAALRAATRSGPLELRSFSPDFASWLRSSALSISRAGYNTTVQLLATGKPAVVVPEPGMSDQGPRSRRLAELGLATVVEGHPPDEAAIAAAIQAALGRPRPRPPSFDLDGVAGTRALLEALGAGSGAWS